MSRRRIEEEDIDTLVGAADKEIDRLMSGTGSRALEDSQENRRNELARLFRARAAALRLKSSPKRNKTTSTKKTDKPADKPRAGWRGSNNEQQQLEQS